MGIHNKLTIMPVTISSMSIETTSETGPKNTMPRGIMVLFTMVKTENTLPG
jgi:hypothetical protein